MIKCYKTAIKPFLASLILGVVLITPAQAQFGDIGTFLKAGADDAAILENILSHTQQVLEQA